nr:MAG TPA: hypothetical protein [Caudoviricetes sp.]
MLRPRATCAQEGWGVWGEGNHRAGLAGVWSCARVDP